MLDIATISSDFVFGLGLNLMLSVSALIGGMLLGGLLALPSFLDRKTPLIISSTVWLFRATPSFVLMFVVVFILYRSGVGNSGDTFWVPFAAVVASLIPFSAAYCADAFKDFSNNLRSGQRREAMLVFPNLVRCLVVLIISSGAAAAVGLPDAVSVLLIASNQLQDTGSKLALLLAGAGVFMAIVQLLYLAADGVNKMILEKMDFEDAVPRTV